MKMNPRFSKCLIGSLATISPGVLSAQVTETSTIENTYSYNLAGQVGSGINSGGAVEVIRRATTGTGISEMFLSLNGTLEQGSFLFLHNGTCVGVCSLTMRTDITFSLFNGGSSPVALRFDSQITPGHLANSFLNPLSQSQASFDFKVSQDPGLRQGVLYQANGDAVQSPPNLVTSNGQPFAGLSLNQNSPAWSAVDWSATNLNVVTATLAPGQTSNLYYRSTLTITTAQPDCPDPTLCESFQVAFGDPRNAGGVLSLSARQSPSSLFAAPLAASNPINPAVGAPYDPFRVSYRFVPLGAPLLNAPPVIPPIQYDVNYRGPGAVPESGTWMLLILGFGLTGALLRKRRNRISFATKSKGSGTPLCQLRSGIWRRGWGPLN